MFFNTHPENHMAEIRTTHHFINKTGAMFWPGIAGAPVLLLIALMSINSRLNFDEGYNLQVPKNLLQFGVYGSQTLSGFKIFDPLISSGPLFLLPVALDLRIFGNGVIQARLVPIAFAILVLAALFSLSRRSNRGPGNVLACVLILVVQDAGYRLGTVVGDGAGIALILIGLMVWSYSEELQSIQLAVISGAIWGTAVWAKPSMIMAVFFICATLLVVLIRDPQRVNRKAMGASILVASIIGGAWFLVSHLSSAPRDSILFGDSSRLIQEQFDLHLSANLLRNLPVLLGSVSLAWLGAGVFNLVRLKVIAQSGHDHHATNWIAQVLPVGWILWFAFFNDTASYRHLFPAMIFGILPFTQAISAPVKSIWAKSVKATLVLLLVIAGIPVILSTAGWLTHLRDSQTALREQSKFAAYIAQLEPEAHIMGWGWFMAWDIAFLSNRTFGDLKAEATVPTSANTYLVITPTILSDPGTYNEVAAIIDRCKPDQVYDSGDYHLYHLKESCAVQ